jgi:hypothetical protein
VTAHHQHRDDEVLILDILQRGLDLMHRSPQRPLQPGILIEAELDARFLEGNEMLCVGFETRSDRVRFLLEITPAAALHPTLQLCKVFAHLLRQFAMTLGIFRILAQQKVFFGATDLEHLHEDLVRLAVDCRRIIGHHAQALLGGVPDQIDSADDRETDDAEDADGRDLVAQTQIQLHEINPSKFEK